MSTHENELVEQFAVLMQAARLEKGVSLSQLARAIGLQGDGTGYLSRVERGETKPSFARAVLIARALDMDMEAFDG